jgi:hypothetical protein
MYINAIVFPVMPFKGPILNVVIVEDKSPEIAARPINPIPTNPMIDKTFAHLAVSFRKPFADSSNCISNFSKTDFSSIIFLMTNLIKLKYFPTKKYQNLFFEAIKKP